LNNKDLQQETELLEADIDTTATSMRKLKHQNIDLKNEEAALQEEVVEEEEKKEKWLEETHQKHVEGVEQLQKRHERDKNKIKLQIAETEEKLEEVVDRLEENQKMVGKLETDTSKLGRQVNVTNKQIEIAEKEKLEMESKKRSLELEFHRASQYLKNEKKVTKVIDNQNKKMVKDAKKKKNETEEEKKKREDLEKTKEQLLEEVEEEKNRLSETRREKSKAREANQRLTNTLSALEDELEGHLDTKENDRQNMKKVHKNNVDKLRHSATKEIRDIEGKKKNAEFIIQELSSALEEEKMLKDKLDAETHKLDEENEAFNQRLKIEIEAKLDSKDSRDKLEQELMKAKSYLEDEDTKRAREQRTKKRQERQSKQIKHQVERLEQEKIDVEKSTNDLEAALLDFQSLDKKTSKKSTTSNGDNRILS